MQKGGAIKMINDSTIEITIIEVLKELQSATDFFINKKVQEKLNCGSGQEGNIRRLINKLHSEKFIISTNDAWYYLQKEGKYSVKVNEEDKYFLNPDIGF